MADKGRGPIGIELVRMGLINEQDINKALEYQKEHPNKKITEIINILGLCDEYKLIEALRRNIRRKSYVINTSRFKHRYNRIYFARCCKEK